MKLSEEIINDVRNSASITEVIGHYIPLVKKGKGFTALCPFHDDHDPSLSISDDKQIYKCFVCGSGGNVFNFVMNFKKVSFPEAVKEVADVIGKPLTIDIVQTPKKIDKNQKYYDLFAKYIEETNYLLTATNAGLKAKEYLNKRGIEDKVINYFNIGLNPSDDFMYHYLHQNGYKDEDMITLGLNRMSNSGMKDVFYNRITFPIHDKDANPVALTARDYLGQSDSKYINTQETLIYTKGNHLYNYHRAKDVSKKNNLIVLVEGTIDVIAYYRAGIENVVASLGTALTEKQLELLRTLSNNVLLSYDGDKAGRAANMKHGEALLNYGFHVEVIDNNTGLDPDEIVNQSGGHVLRDLYSKRLSFIDYAIAYYKELYNLNNYADRKEMTRKVSLLIDKLKDQYDKDNYENALFELTKIKIIQTSTNTTAYQDRKPTTTVQYSMDGLTKAEYSILLMISISKDALDRYQKELGYLIDSNNQKLAIIIIDEYRKKNECRLSKLLDEVDDEKIKQLIITLATNESLPQEYDIELFESAIEKVKREIKKQKLEDLKEKINKTSIVDPMKAYEYLNEYQNLLRELGGKMNA